MNELSNSLQVFQYNAAPVTFKRIDGSMMVNASQMAKSFGKQPKDWLRTESSREFLDMLSSDRQISLSQLVQVQKGGNTHQQGTWMHEDVALEFARWLSPKFAIWCNDRIKELLTTGITATQPALEQLLQDPTLILGMAQKLIEQRKANNSWRQQITAQQKQIEVMSSELIELREQQSYVEQVLASRELVTITQIAADYGMSAKALNKKLAELKVQYKVNGQWILYSCYAAKGYTHSRTIDIVRANGAHDTVMHTEWRQAGRLFLYNMLKEHGILPIIERNTINQ